MKKPIVTRLVDGIFIECDMKDLKDGDIVQMIHPDDQELYKDFLMVNGDAFLRDDRPDTEPFWDFMCTVYTGDIK
jgi:general stress protein 26